MQKGCDVSNLIAAHAELRHAAIRSPVLHNGADQFTVLIVEDHGGAKEAWSAIATTRIRAVTEGAVGAVDAAPALDRRGIARRTHGVRADTRATDAAAASSGGWRLLRDRDHRADCHDDHDAERANAHRLDSVASGPTRYGLIAA